MNGITTSWTAARRQPAHGFTLLELLVVVTVLAAIAGGVIVSLGNLRETALQQTGRMEMQKVKEALLRFRQDTGHLPAPSNPADFSALYAQGAEPAWDMASGRGWRGPYLTSVGEGLVDIGDSLQADGTGSLVVVIAAPRNEVRGVADPFVAHPVKSGVYVSCEASDPDSACLLDWRTVPGEARHPRWGRPYLLFELNVPDRARLVSMGPDGRYAGMNAVEPCAPLSGSDDLVLCLLR